MTTEKSKKMVYVVEDDTEQLFVMRILLSDAGYDVVTEADADRVIDGVQSLKPDIILLDVMLPSQTGLDGFELCSQIRQLPGFDKTVIVIISAIAEGAGPLRKKMTDQVGADDFIIKPYDPPALVQRLQELTGE